MGLFGSMGRNLKENWKNGGLMANLQSAGAIAGGDYGTAAQIQGQHRKGLKERAEEEAGKLQLQQTIHALVSRGVPAQEAAIIAQSGGAGGFIAQQNQPRAPSEFERTMQGGGIDPNSEQGRALYAQRAATMASPAPQMIGTPETGYTWHTPPPPSIPGLGSIPPTPARPQAPQQAIPFEAYVGAARSLGPQEAASWAQRNNHIVAVSSPEQAQQLPPGTRYRTPDGQEYQR